MLATFKELSIRSSQVSLEQLADAVEEQEPQGWRRNRELEERLRPSGEVQLCFSREREATLKAAHLWLGTRSEGELYVTNIVPDGVQLTHQDYNALLDEFAARCIEPVKAKLGLVVEATSGVLDLEAMLGADTFRALERFANSANPSTGTSHPSDQKLWFDFVVSAHRAGVTLSPDTLIRWLDEEKGWDESIANRVGIEFEQESELLHHYDRRRQ